MVKNSVAVPCKVCGERATLYCLTCGEIFYCKRHACHHFTKEELEREERPVPQNWFQDAQQRGVVHWEHEAPASPPLSQEEIMAREMYASDRRVRDSRRRGIGAMVFGIVFGMVAVVGLAQGSIGVGFLFAALSAFMLYSAYDRLK